MIPYSALVAMAAFILIPAGIGMVRFNRLKPALKPFALLMVIGAVNETVMFILAIVGIQNLFTLHIYTIAELICLAFFYHRSLRNNVAKRAIVFSVLFLILTALTYSSLNENLFGFNSIPRALESFFIIILALIFFYELATTGDGIDPKGDGAFYINGGILFYFTASFLIFTFAKYVGSQQYLITMYLLHAYVNAICNLVYAFGLWKSTSTTFSSVA